jgi:hypothetical protein
MTTPSNHDSANQRFAAVLGLFDSLQRLDDDLGELLETGSHPSTRKKFLVTVSRARKALRAIEIGLAELFPMEQQ